MIADFWGVLEARAKLPASAAAFFDQYGPMPRSPANRRAYHRYFLRDKAVLKRGESFLAVYTKDLSRQGVGIISPVQLLPMERIGLRLAIGKKYILDVTRCRRLNEKCYEIGTRFVLGTDSNSFDF